MKRKRQEEQIDDPQLCDLILIDANGRSIRVHKALLIDKSGYFARVLSESNLSELQLNETHLIELIHYLYNHEKEDACHTRGQFSCSENHDSITFDDETGALQTDPSLTNGDLQILMHLLALSRKYAFIQLYSNLMVEINYKLSPQSIITIYKCAMDLGIEELQESTKLMILSWLPQLQYTQQFYSLSEESINDIFTGESPDIDNECKLNALSSWWSHNKECDMTTLWSQLRTCTSR